ncbi:restriction endonuclease [Neisseria arctica]|uniref:restriction endonuclease n=1 Tax=Neisseria arctica TaxID=1470200 RepID=UPI000ABFCCB3|nr:restriction endonuclease [Neisseria arctica]UOO86504.1 restriction endonuclease [Neisseria arctica]
MVCGNTWLAAGGNGLERLVKELLEIEGYSAKIESKNQSSGIADIDISAEKIDRFNQCRLLIQVKHHKGETNSHGLKQLIAYDDNDETDAQKWLITTADLSDASKQLAEANQIRVMNGKALVDWIDESLEYLSVGTKQRLGIINVPQLVKSK